MHEFRDEKSKAIEISTKILAAQKQLPNIQAMRLAKENKKKTFLKFFVIWFEKKIKLNWKLIKIQFSYCIFSILPNIYVLLQKMCYEEKKTKSKQTANVEYNSENYLP